MNRETLLKLRNKKSIRFFKPYMNCGKHFFQIQLNKNVNGICWERWVSKDKQNWIQLNACLSLHEIDDLIKKEVW